MAYTKDRPMSPFFPPTNCYLLYFVTYKKKLRNRFQVRLLFTLKSISDTLFNFDIFIAKRKKNYWELKAEHWLKKRIWKKRVGISKVMGAAFSSSICLTTNWCTGGSGFSVTDRIP